MRGRLWSAVVGCGRLRRCLIVKRNGSRSVRGSGGGVVGNLEAENWRLCSTTLVHGVAGELEAENWRLSSTTLVRGAICGAGS